MPVPAKFDSSVAIAPIDSAAPTKFGADVQVQPLDSAQPPAPAQFGSIHPLSEQDQLERTYPVGATGEGLGENALNFTRNMFTGAYGVLAHPLKTAEGVISSVNPWSDTPNPIQSLYEGLNTRPGDTISTGLGQAAVMSPVVELAGKAVGPATRALVEKASNARGKLVETATGTGPKTTAAVVKQTQAGNAAADSYSNVRSKIETARENAKTIGNEKFNGVNKALNHIEADPEFLPGTLEEASAKIKGSNTEPTILRDIEKRVQRGDVPTYEDLQGYYSELGNEISKGTLPGDVYHAYDTLHESIGNEMQRIADAKGQGEALPDARGYWRRMKQTFGKPLNATDSATSVLKSAAPDIAEQDTLANRVRLLGSFDPEIPKAFEDLNKTQEAAKGLSKPNPGETNTVGPDEVREAKAEGLQNRAELVRKWGQRVAKYGIGLKALWDGFRGDFEGAGMDVASAAVGYKAAGWIANALEKPEVVKFLTEPTARDIEQIPPEIRGQFPEIVKAAQAKGIKIDPKIAALAGAVGPQTRKLQELRDNTP